MFNKIIVPVDGSKPADKALDHTIHLAKSISVNGSINKIGIIILSVIPDLPATLGYKPPRRSIKTGEVISFSEYINEMHELKRSNAIKLVSARKKGYESHITTGNDFTLREEVLVSHGNSFVLLTYQRIVDVVANRYFVFDKEEKVGAVVILFRQTFFL